MKELMSKQTTDVFGKEYELESVGRILGGAQKYTYLAKCTNGFKFVIYQWDKSTTYFEKNDESCIFYSNSANLFQNNNELMIEQGVLTPKLFYMNKSRCECDCEYAFVEYINGHDADYIMEKEPGRLDEVLESLSNSIDRLHSIKNDVMGQLGANHVIVDKDNNAYLIDIEGAKFYDVEEELSFLDMRFNKRLGKEDIVDEQRMYFYYIGHCLGSLHGAVELKQKGYYDIDNVNGMIEFFHKQMAKII